MGKAENCESVRAGDEGEGKGSRILGCKELKFRALGSDDSVPSSVFFSGETWCGAACLCSALLD